MPDRFVPLSDFLLSGSGSVPAGLNATGGSQRFTPVSSGLGTAGGGVPSGGADAGGASALGLVRPAFALGNAGSQAFTGNSLLENLSNYLGFGGGGVANSLGGSAGDAVAGAGTAASGAGSALGSIGGGASLAGTLLSALGGLTGSKELGMAGGIAGLGGSLASLGGTLAATPAQLAAMGLSGAAGFAFAPVALGIAGAGLSDMFDTSAADFAKSSKDLFSSVPSVVQRFSTAPELFGQLGPTTTPDEAKRIYDALQGLQDQFQNTGVENLFKSGGRVTGENTKFDLFGGEGNYSAQFPGDVGAIYKGMLPAGLAVALGRLRAADIIGKATGKPYGLDPMSYARTFGGEQTLADYQARGDMPTAFTAALGPALDTVYESDYYDNWQGLSDARAAIAAARAPGSLYAEVMGLAPGNYEQGLSDIIARYGGWGGIGTPAHGGAPAMNLSGILAAPSTSARFTPV